MIYCSSYSSSSSSSTKAYFVKLSHGNAGPAMHPPVASARPFSMPRTNMPSTHPIMFISESYIWESWEVVCRDCLYTTSKSHSLHFEASNHSVSVPSKTSTTSPHRSTCLPHPILIYPLELPLSGYPYHPFP